MLEESQRRASRISGGAAADPRRKDEFLSKGIPSSVGAPHGSFRSVLDISYLTSRPSHYVTPARHISAGAANLLQSIRLLQTCRTVRGAAERARESALSGIAGLLVQPPTTVPGARGSEGLLSFLVV